MQSRPPVHDIHASVLREETPRIWPMVFTACSGLMGGAGVMIAAAGAHVGGGDVARTAADFLMIHAAVILAASTLAALRRGADVWLGMALGLLTVGSILFSGELALGSLAEWRPLPLAAPTGGLCLIAGWLALTVFGVRACRATTFGPIVPTLDGK